MRTGAAPQVRAACLNLVIARLRRAGHSGITAALRTFAGRPAQAVHLVRTAGRQLMNRPLGLGLTVRLDLPHRRLRAWNETLDGADH